MRSRASAGILTITSEGIGDGDEFAGIFFELAQAIHDSKDTV